MTPLQAEDLLSQLKLKSLGLDELHERVRLSGSGWTRDQLELFLRCARGITRDGTGAFYAVADGAGDDLGARRTAGLEVFGPNLIRIVP